MSVSLIEIVRRGGCYWEQKRGDSPGHSIVIPNGTPFKIAIEGPQSHQFKAGTCRDCYFVMDEGDYAGTKFDSANAAVNIVRDPSSNAFLYLHFYIAGHWILADELRRLEDSRLDEVEEAALADALYDIGHHPRGKTLGYIEATRKAADLVARHPTRIDNARERLAVAANLDLSDFGL